MASRLSETSEIALYDCGYQSFSQVNKKAKLPSIDLDGLVAHPEAKKLIELVPPQPLYYALKNRGLTESLDVLEIIPDSTLKRLLDYDTWREDRLCPEKVFQWLNLYHSISPKKLFQRYSKLEEELQVALLGPYLKIYSKDEFEDLEDMQQDCAVALPGEEIYYHILTDDEKIRTSIQNLIDSCLQEDINYTISLLYHAAYLPLNEQEHNLARFRKARIEEDGFVSYEESLSFFRHFCRKSFDLRWQKMQPKKDLHPVKKNNKVLLIDQVVSLWKSENPGHTSLKEMQLSRGLLHLTNGLLAASKFEADDIKGLEVVLLQAKSLVNLGLDYASSSDLETASLILEKEYPKTLFQVGLSVIKEAQEDFIERLEKKELTAKSLKNTGS